MKLELKGKKTLSELLSLFEDGKRYGGTEFAEVMNHAKNVLSEDEVKALGKHFTADKRCGAVLIFHA